MSWYGKLFGGIGKGLKAAVGFAQDHGLTDEILKLALQWVKVAEAQNIDNPAKRELVVKVLVGKGVPENVARLAVELGVQTIHAETRKLEAEHA